MKLPAANISRVESPSVHITDVEIDRKTLVKRRQSTVSPVKSNNVRNKIILEICHSCRKPIGHNFDQEMRISAMEEPLHHWHVGCFVCSGCQISLVGLSYFQPRASDNELILCANCMDKRYADQCGKCHQKINCYSKEEQKLASKGGHGHWHSHCYACWKCNRALSSTDGHYKHESYDGMYCEECYDEITSKLCARCKKRIYRISRREQQISSQDGLKHWHVECYSCWTCQKPLATSKNVVHYNGGTYCPGCFKQIAIKP